MKRFYIKTDKKNEVSIKNHFSLYFLNIFTSVIIKASLKGKLSIKNRINIQRNALQS